LADLAFQRAQLQVRVYLVPGVSVELCHTVLRGELVQRATGPAAAGRSKDGAAAPRAGYWVTSRFQRSIH
jgi:hypothetical protein